MAPLRAGIGLCLGAALSLGGAQAQDAFDDPSGSGSVPCIVLNRYEVESLGRPHEHARYRAAAVIENICGRAMEVRFCFLRAEPVDGADRSCFQGPLRPWAMASVEENDAPARITAPEYQWRHLRR
jgi:hypothetical protein